jgi:hypothetical protein
VTGKVFGTSRFCKRPKSNSTRSLHSHSHRNRRSLCTLCSLYNHRSLGSHRSLGHIADPA